MPDARGRHDMACRIEWQPIDDIAQEWYRDFGCDYDYGARMYLSAGSQRRMMWNRIESFWSVLHSNASLFSERYRNVELNGLVPEDVVEHRPEESWSQINYRQKLHEFDIDYAEDGSRDILRRWLKHNTDGRFRPDFAVVKPVLGATAGIQAEYTERHRLGMDFLNSAEGESLKSFFLDLAPYERESIIARYGTWAAALSVQDCGDIGTEIGIGSHRLCDLLNALARAIVGPTYRNLFHWAGKLTLDVDGMDPDSDDQDDDSHADLDIVILKRGRQTLGAFSHDELVAVGSGTTEAWNDMDWNKSVLPLMIGVRQLIGGNPIAGPVLGFTWHGHRIRYWSVAPTEYSSSRLIDLKKGVHMSDLVDMVIYLLGPVDSILPRWRPHSQISFIKPGSGQPAVTGSWTPAGEWTGIVHSRKIPIGSRTAVWEGTFTKLTGRNQQSPEQPVDVVVKASWLDEALVHHEYKILDTLVNDNARLHFPVEGPSGSHLEDRLQHRAYMAEIGDIEIIKRKLPKPLGALTVMDAPKYRMRLDKEEARSTRTKEEAGQMQPPSPPWVTLATLVTEGPADKHLDDIAELSTKQFLWIFIDAFRILWYLACRGVHYRDLNLGNILIRLDPDFRDEVKYRGILIDFGNAVYAGERRRRPTSLDEMKQACQDDGRSANAYFMCLDSYESLRLVKALEAAEAGYKGLVEEGDPFMIKAAEQRLETARRALDDHTLHRYTSDLESALYCMCFLIGKRLQSVANPDANPAFALKDEAFKRECWKSNMNLLITRMRPSGRYLAISAAIMQVAQTIRDTQAQLASQRGKLPIEITQIEHETFRTCIQLMEEAAAEKLPTDEILLENVGGGVADFAW